MVFPALLLMSLACRLQVPAQYDPSWHIAFLDKKVAVIQETLKNLQNKKISAKVAVGRIGEILGDSRQLQTQLSNWMRKNDPKQSTLAMRILQAQSLFESYLASQILALDGDNESKQLAKFLETRLLKLLPTFRKR